MGKLLQEEAGRENLLSMRNPQPIPVLFNCLNTGTPHTVIAAITAMRTLTEAPETRKVFVRNVKDWTDITNILKEEHGWQARSEAARCLGLCSQYGSGDKQSAQYVRLNTGRAGGIQHLVDMCSPDQDWGAAGAVASGVAAAALAAHLADDVLDTGLRNARRALHRGMVRGPVVGAHELLVPLVPGPGAEDVPDGDSHEEPDHSPHLPGCRPYRAAGPRRPAPGTWDDLR